MIFRGKFSAPMLISVTLALSLVLWLIYEIASIYESTAAKRNAMEWTIESVTSRRLHPGSPTLDQPQVEILKKELKKELSPLFNDMDTRQNLLITVLAMGVALTSLVFIAWTYALRNKELQKRLETAMSRKTEVDEIGLAAAGLAHETKNPLGVIRGLAQNIADNPKNPDTAREKAREIMEETDVTTARLGDFLSYARIRSPKPQDLNAKAHIERMAGLMADDFKNADIALKVDVAPLILKADPDMLAQVIMNLLSNCLKFTSAGDKVEIVLRSSKRGLATLKVADSGEGIPPDLLPQVFKPYVTKSTGGCGIGLAIVKRIADQAGWNVQIKSKHGKGTEVIIADIPVATAGE